MTALSSALSMRDIPVLVTGGAGFIGSHLVEHLVELGGKITVIDNLSTGSKENLARVLPEIDLLTCDLSESLQQGYIKIGDYRYIFHLAANAYIPPSVERPYWDFQTNLHTTLLLLEELRKYGSGPRLVFASSAAVYGNPAQLPISEGDPTVPISPYGVSKLAAERYIAVYCQTYGVHASSLRFFSVYGPRQRKQVVYDLLQKLNNNPQHINVYGDGSQMRDFTYVSDVVQSMLLTATCAPGKGEVLNVASGATHTITELITAWCKICELKPEITFSGTIRPGDAERWEVDISRLTALGYQAATSLDEGLRLVKCWYGAANG